MSEIPFVNRLGDAIQAAITSPAAARHRVSLRRRLGLLAVAALLLVGATAAATRILGTPEELAASGITCLEDNGGAGVWDPGRSPIQACAQEYRHQHPGRPVPAMVACVDGPSVVVVQAHDPQVCARRGLAPLPAVYTPARAKVAKLERDILALEATADCIPPEELAARVQALLDRNGWAGWRTWLRLDASQGPCGSAASQQDGEANLGGHLDYQDRRVMVFGQAPRSLLDLLYRRGGLAETLLEESGRRCYTLDQLRDLIRRRVAVTGRSVRFQVGTRQPQPGRHLGDAREQRYQAGCAIVAAVGPDGNNQGVEVAIHHKR